MDMDELFSQVDEKRKVSMKILFRSLISTCLSSDFPYSSVPGAVGRKFMWSTGLLRVLADTLALNSHHGSRLLTWQQECEEAAALAASCALVTAHYASLV